MLRTWAVFTFSGKSIYNNSMIYLNNNTEAQQVFIPRTGIEEHGPLELSLRSTVDMSVVLKTKISDIGTSSLYYRTAIVLPDGCPDGSYEYRLMSDGHIISSGTVTVGEYRRDHVTVYDKSEEYEQYEQEQ